MDDRPPAIGLSVEETLERERTLGLALSIIKVDKGQVRRKNSATRSLVHYMGTIVCAIVRHNPTVDDAMANKNTALDNFHGLNKILDVIERFVNERVSQSMLVRMMKRLFSSKKIPGFRDDLTRILDSFGLKPTELTPQTLPQTELSLEKMLRELRENKHKIRKGSNSDTMITTYTKSSYRDPPYTLPSPSTSQVLGGTSYVDGDQTVVYASSRVTNENSGNVTTIITKGSNNRY